MNFDIYKKARSYLAPIYRTVLSMNSIYWLSVFGVSYSDIKPTIVNYSIKGLIKSK